MATGDKNDIASRIATVLPTGWFSSTGNLLTAIVQGLASGHAFIYSLIQNVKLQSRIKTANDAFLDLIARDFFGSNLNRGTNQSDANFRSQIIFNLFRERATRSAIINVLTDLTGRAPKVIEPQRPLDCGAYGSLYGYGTMGAYGSVVCQFDAFVRAYRPQGSGIPYVAGYGISSGGYSQASQADYASINSVLDYVTDANIYAAIDSVKPVATNIYVSIS